MRVAGKAGWAETFPEGVALKSLLSSMHIVCRLGLSWILYFAGDIVSKTILRLGIGYGTYSRLMRLSVDLDDKGHIWKPVAKP